MPFEQYYPFVYAISGSGNIHQFVFTGSVSFWYTDYTSLGEYYRPVSIGYSMYIRLVASQLPVQTMIHTVYRGKHSTVVKFQTWIKHKEYLCSTCSILWYCFPQYTMRIIVQNCLCCNLIVLIGIYCKGTGWEHWDLRPVEARDMAKVLTPGHDVPFTSTSWTGVGTLAISHHWSSWGSTGLRFEYFWMVSFVHRSNSSRWTQWQYLQDTILMVQCGNGQTPWMLTINPLPEALQGSNLSILSWFFQHLDTVQLPEHSGTSI